MSEKHTAEMALINSDYWYLILAYAEYCAAATTALDRIWLHGHISDILTILIKLYFISLQWQLIVSTLCRPQNKLAKISDKTDKFCVKL